MALNAAREKLDQVLDHAFEEQSFGPIEALFCEEEAALSVYQEAAAELAQAEERCCALRVALAQERALMLVGPMPRQRLH